MKKALYISLFAALSFASCEVISEKDRLLPYTPEDGDRVALITEFSGFMCLNCPKAAEEAHQLLETNPGRIVVVAMHPASNSLTAAPQPKYNYTCPASDIYYKYFDGTNTTPFPQGVVNMSRQKEQGEAGWYFTNYSTWGAQCIPIISQQAQVKIEQTIQADPETRTLRLTPTITSATASEVKDIAYIAWLVQDSIIGGQLMPDGIPNEAYVHNHLLRDTITPAWGIPVEIKPYEATTLTEITYTVPEKVYEVPIDMKHIYVVGLVLQKTGEADGKPTYDVLQVLQTKVLE